ncbi:MAG: HU family DNA-binding protein [Thermodesulfobacteriota bacterium]|nr:HU family DNA-binding protein [Thermodesulfobacteriota bacterium]
MKRNDKITFSDLVGRIADEAKVSQNATRHLLKEMSSIIDDRLVQEGKVSISGLGIFKLKWQAAKTGMNPQTGEPIEISSQNRVVFKPAADLRRYINRSYENEQPEYIDDVKDTPAVYSEKPNFRTRWPTTKRVGLLIVLILLILSAIFYVFKPSVKSPVTVKRNLQQGTEKVPGQPAEKLLTGKKSVDSPFKSVVSSGGAAHPVDKSGYTQHITTGDTLWMISKAFYADPFLWPNIFRVNLSVIKDPDVLEVGETIRTPPLEGTAEHLTPRDRMNIADGYFQVYLAYRRLGKKKAPLFLRVARQYNVPEISARYKDKLEKSKPASNK